MTTYLFTLNETCAGGEHIGINVSTNGGAGVEFRYEIGELIVPLTNEEKAVAVTVVLRLAGQGRTKAQIRTALTAGYSVTI